MDKNVFEDVDKDNDDDRNRIKRIDLCDKS